MGNDSSDEKPPRPAPPERISIDDLLKGASEMDEARERRVKAFGAMIRDYELETLRSSQAELGARLGIFEQRLLSLVDRILELLVSDQEHDEALISLRQEISLVRTEMQTMFSLETRVALLEAAMIHLKAKL